jgi:hypothetical protein
MKRFRPQYLTAVFLGEGLTGAIPTLLLLIQGIGSETVCVQSSNGTTLEPTFTEPRFSTTIFMLLITGIIVTSFIAFLLLRWTNIISLANAAEPVRYILKVKTFSITQLQTDFEYPKNFETEIIRVVFIKTILLFFPFF